MRTQQQYYLTHELRSEDAREHYSVYSTAALSFSEDLRKYLRRGDKATREMVTSAVSVYTGVVTHF
jgi:hypothetical protein